MTHGPLFLTDLMTCITHQVINERLKRTGTIASVLEVHCIKFYCITFRNVFYQIFKKIVDYINDIRLNFGRPEHCCQAPGTVKIQTGQKLDVL